MCVRKRRPWKFATFLLMLAPLAGCGAHWNADWGGCHSGGHIPAHGDGGSGLLVLGIVGIAWGIEELLEAMSSR